MPSKVITHSSTDTEPEYAVPGTHLEKQSSYSGTAPVLRQASVSSPVSVWAHWLIRLLIKMLDGDWGCNVRQV